MNKESRSNSQSLDIEVVTLTNEVVGESSVVETTNAKGWSEDKYFVVGLLFVIKAVILTVTGQSNIVNRNESVGGIWEWMLLFNRWDALHYERLAEFGYGVSESLKPSMVFYPLFPWLIRVASYVTQEYVLSAFIVATLASIGAVFALYKLALLEFGRETALRSVWFLLIFPTSYFLHIPYTEGLFLSVSIGSLYFARRGRWPLAAFLGILACLTRANGLVLVPTLAVEAFLQYRSSRSWENQWLLILLVPVGFVIYLAINQSAAGDALAFIQIRKDFFFISSTTPWDGLVAAFYQLKRNPADSVMVGLFEVAFILIGLAAGIFSLFKLRASYSVWILTNWLLIVSVTFVASVPRYTLSLFPIFFIFGMLGKDRRVMAVFSVISIIYLSFFSSLFGRGFWAF